jgi:hypothetical protein
MKQQRLGRFISVTKLSQVLSSGVACDTPSSPKQMPGEKQAKSPQLPIRIKYER